MYENYRVLFVDDEPNILNTLRRGLVEEEYFCHFASSGKEALEIIDKEKIAVIVTDMRMPEMNGLELLNEVSEKSPATVKLVLSGYTQLPQILATINQVDIFKFITKPWQLSDLIMVIRKSLDFYIIREENAHYKLALEAKNLAYQNILKRINEVIEDAKKSSEVLGSFGKAILGFGKTFSPVDRMKYQSIFQTQDELFGLFSRTITVEKHETDTVKLVDHIADYIQHLNPEGKLERNYGPSPVTVKVNVTMLETAINALYVVFYDEFQRGGFYSRVSGGEEFRIAIICPSADESRADASDQAVLRVKADYIRSVLSEALELYQIRVQAETVGGNLVAELALKKSEDGIKDEQGEIS